MRALSTCRVTFRSDSGTVVAHLALVPANDAWNAATAPLVETDESDASGHGETTIQLREAERYEYEVIAENGADLRLRCALSNRRRGLGTTGRPDAGLIETRSYCGTLLLELVDGEVNGEKPTVASALLDVRSLKLDYRTEYRGMLRRLSDELAGLVADARSSTKAGFLSSFEQRTDEGWLQIQLELLRETLDGYEFIAALHRIVSFPHERLSTVSGLVSTDQSIRWEPSAVRQLVSRNPRRLLPASHPLRTGTGLDSIAEHVLLQRKSRDLDTPENRFVKFSLNEFRAFLLHAQRVFESCIGWGASAALARRLAASVENWLGRGLFRGVGEMQFSPMGSAVLQRKAGYREVFRWWLRFRTAAELSWEGGKDLFRAGQRDVASLYEYWLFFELLDWFCRKFRGGDRPAVEELIDGLEMGSPNLRLRKRVELGPFVGTFAGQSRRLNAKLSYNKRFKETKNRHEGGSWTRSLHPDYTLTFWPEALSEDEAERQESLVHVHFDAKYRVENIEGLFGIEDADDADIELDGNYKRPDLLKMHAYRDAIKRSQGAYVLYPGRSNIPVKFSGFHEILPGLGAFGVAPDENGQAQGLRALEDFLDELLQHLVNRTTAQERVTYHISEAYAPKDKPVPIGTIHFSEMDSFGEDFRALPPAEHMVLVAWYSDDEQLAWTKKSGRAIVRLGKRPGAWHVQPEFAETRHILLHSRAGASAPGLWRLSSPGYRVYTDIEVKALGYPGPAGGEIYAVFEVEEDPDWASVYWEPQRLLRAIRGFESRIKHKLVTNEGRRSAYPRILPIQDLLKAIA